jgi:hypothetical protein
MQGKQYFKMLPTTVAILFIFFHLIMTQDKAVDPWKMAGLGMFSKISSRIMRVYGVAHDNQKYLIKWNREKLNTNRDKLQSYHYYNAINYPVESNFKILETKFLKYRYLTTRNGYEIVSNNDVVYGWTKKEMFIPNKEELKEFEGQKLFKSFKFVVWNREYDQSTQKVKYVKVAEF